MLDALSQTNLFLTPLDDEGRWYRFHHLFAQLLRVELERREPDLAPVLRRRAMLGIASTVRPMRRSSTP